MNDRTCRTQNLINLFLQVVEGIRRNERKARVYGGSPPLFPSEIHMIMRIGQNPGIHPAALAALAAVTRGAVSQVLAKLEAKELITRTDEISDDGRYQIWLTPAGKSAFEGHEQYHATMDTPLIQRMSDMSDSEFQVLEDFFVLLKEMTERHR
ncbi:MarR family transcriptional regulator [Desulfobotulus sp. H1]|uniref:MarR family transcriptional regulator n=1 Tax=Desulfobotulus pelophilus TaxID=2823377 RepID=A0ABT3N7P6_9BACT|nr:MarR family transcriptional regulator [Desulfobotulus pelophilus]MCW7753476.1 MarR family transcriptional regulator [Desulfobotulus pelophilus]